MPRGSKCGLSVVPHAVRVAGCTRIRRGTQNHTQISIFEVGHGRESKIRAATSHMVLVAQGELAKTAVLGAEMKEGRGALHTNTRQCCCAVAVSRTVICSSNVGGPQKGGRTATRGPRGHRGNGRRRCRRPLQKAAANATAVT